MTKRGKGGGDKVGYRRPPKHSQFKKGQSGNPKGRPKGRKNSDTILDELLNQKREFRVAGRPRKMTNLEAIYMGFVESALRRDPKAATFLLNRYQKIELGGDNIDDLSDDERAILESYAHRLQDKKGGDWS